MHSRMRDGFANASPRLAAARATARRSANLSSYSCSAFRPPGHVDALRSCQTTTSASRPTTPPIVLSDSAYPAASNNRRACANRSWSRGCERTLRRVSTAARSGSTCGSTVVHAPSPGSVMRCRTTNTGT